MKNTRIWLVRLVSLIAFAIMVVYLLPVLIELWRQDFTTENAGLLSVVLFLCVASLSGLTVWANESWLNHSTFFKIVSAVLALLLGIVFSIFTYANWLLLVTTIAGFYFWFNRMLKKQSTTCINLSIISVLSMALTVYILINLLG